MRSKGASSLEAPCPGLVGLVDGRLRLGCVEFGIILAAVVPPVVVMLLSARLRVVGGLCRLLHFKQGVGFEHEFDFAEKLRVGICRMRSDCCCSWERTCCWESVARR